MGPQLLLILFSISCMRYFCEGIDSNRLKRSLEYFEEGNILCDEEQYQLALPFYRAALRLSPDHPLFIKKTAALELKLNNLENARKLNDRLLTFGLEGIAIPDIDTLDNSDIKSGKCLHHPEHHLVQLQELSSHLTCDESFSSCALRDFDEVSMKPFILRNAASLMGWNTSSLDNHSLIENYGHRITDFYPQNLLSKPHKVYQKTIQEVLAYIAYPDGAYLSVDASHPGAYAQWNVDDTSWRFLLQQLLITVPIGLDRDVKGMLGAALADCGDACPRIDLHADKSRFDTAVDHFYHQTHWHMVLIGEEG